MTGTNTYTNENNNFYNETIKEISQVGGNCGTKFGTLWSCFVDMGALANTHTENGLKKIWLMGKEYQCVWSLFFVLTDAGLYDEVEEKNTSNQLTAAQRRSWRFLSFTMKVHPYQDDIEWN